MADRTLHLIENALKSIASSLSRIEKNTAPVRSSGNRPRTHGGVLQEQVPLEIDWTPAAIKTEASFIVQDDGKVVILIEVVGEDADILIQSIPDTPVEYLQLISVAK
jgi:hypothetical protein